MKIAFNSNQNCFKITEPKELSEFSFFSKDLSQEDLQSRIEVLLKHLEAHKEVFELLKKVLAEGPLKLQFSILKGCAADWTVDTRVIRMNVDRKHPYAMLTSFLFELCNAENPGFKKLTMDEFSSSEEFALAIEKLEYHSSVKRKNLLNQGVREYGWPKFELDKNELSSLNYENDSFENYLQLAKQPEIHYEGFSHFERCQIRHMEYNLYKIDKKIFSLKKELILAESEQRINGNQLRSTEEMLDFYNKFKVDHPEMFTNLQEEKAKLFEEERLKYEAEKKEAINKTNQIHETINTIKKNIQEANETHRDLFRMKVRLELKAEKSKKQLEEESRKTIMKEIKKEKLPLLELELTEDISTLSHSPRVNSFLSLYSQHKNHLEQIEDALGSPLPEIRSKMRHLKLPNSDESLKQNQAILDEIGKELSEFRL